MRPDREDEDRFQQAVLAIMQVSHLALIELIKSRGGIGPWLDDFQTKVVEELKNPKAEGVGMSDEFEYSDAMIHLANTVFDGARKDFDSESFE